MKNYAAFLILLLAVSSGAQARGLLSGAAGVVAGETAKSAMSPSLEKALAQVATDLNAKAPIMVNNDTRLDHVTAGPGRRITYQHTLTTLPSTQVDPALWTQQSAIMRRTVCGTAQMAALFDNGVTVAYAYAGSDGLPVGTLDITPHDCGR